VTANPKPPPCTYWDATKCQYCEATPTRPHIQGPRCTKHSPAALVGEPEPGQGAYCAPLRCYCSDPECPAYASYVPRDTQVDEPSREAS
jgi:hypothetical protein